MFLGAFKTPLACPSLVSAPLHLSRLPSLLTPTQLHLADQEHTPLDVPISYNGSCAHRALPTAAAAGLFVAMPAKQPFPKPTPLSTVSFSFASRPMCAPAPLPNLCVAWVPNAERQDWDWLKLSFSREQATQYLLQHPQQLCVVRTSTSLPDRLGM